MWFQNLFKSRNSASPGRRPTRRPTTRLRLEALEDRRVPSTFTVTNTLDDGSVGSLRWAVGQANDQVGADTITFDETVFRTPQSITLAGSQLELTGDLVLSGPEVGVTIDANALSRVIQVNAGRVSITGLTITGGSVTNGDDGGGIYNGFADLSLNRCTISANSAVSRFGGGIYNLGKLTMNNCTVSGNTAGIGGGISHSTNFSGITMTNCTVSNNYAFTNGGGAFITSSAELTNCTFTRNLAGHVFIFSRGGGIYSDSVGGTLRMLHCTISDNVASEGESLYTVALQWLDNSIVTGLTSSNEDWNLPVDAISRGFGSISGSIGGLNNLIGTGGSGGLIDGVGGNIVGVADPRLALLGDYGGPTQTMPPLPGSRALDAGGTSDIFDRPPTADQRGLGRVGAIDIGAAERQPPAITAPAAQTTLADVATVVSGIRVSGDPMGDTPFTVALAVGQGTLSFATTSGLSVTGIGTGMVSVSGSIADLNIALGGLTYRASLNYQGPDTLGLTASDGHLSTQASISISVQSVAEYAADLQTSLSSLRDAAVLSQGQANSLIAALNLHDNNGDIGKVRTFLRKVRVLLDAGVLTQAEADALLESGSILLIHVTQR